MKNNKTEYFPIPELRRSLHQASCALAARLSRSVGRLTSCDELPCLEYGEEIRFEYALARQLFYTQQCRDALEHCIDGKCATVRYRWTDGRQTRTTFRKIGPNRVKVTGLVDVHAA
jgi:hypothetical protein